MVEALGARAGDLIGLVGGGGKTTLMYRAAQDLASAGLRVAAATTTKIFRPGPEDPVALVLAQEYAELVAKLAQVKGLPVLGRSLLTETKVQGVPPEWCDRLVAEGVVDCLVVEADGAARKPVKAPEAWEPVLPAATTLFVAVVGLTCLDKPLTAEFAFRPELVAAATGCELGAAITPTIVARLLAAPDGLLKGCPRGARRVILLNQADDEVSLQTARKIVRELPPEVWERVLIASLGRDREVGEVWVA